jgi:hypothetical protein
MSAVISMKASFSNEARPLREGNERPRNGIYFPAAHFSTLIRNGRGIRGRLSRHCPRNLRKGARLCAKRQPQQRTKTPAFYHPRRCFQKSALRLAFSTAGECRNAPGIRASSFFSSTANADFADITALFS